MKLTATDYERILGKLANQTVTTKNHPRGVSVKKLSDQELFDTRDYLPRQPGGGFYYNDMSIPAATAIEWHKQDAEMYALDAEIERRRLRYKWRKNGSEEEEEAAQPGRVRKQDKPKTFKQRLNPTPLSPPKVALSEYSRLLSARSGMSSQEKRRLIKGIEKLLPEGDPVTGWGFDFYFPDVGRRHLQGVLKYLEGEGYRIVKVKDTEMDFSSDYPREDSLEEDAKKVTVAPMHMVLG